MRIHCLLLFGAGATAGCVGIEYIDPDPALAGEQVEVEMDNIVGPSLLEPGATVSFDGTAMSLAPDTSSTAGFVVPTGTPPGDYVVRVYDPPGLLEILSIVLLFRDRDAESTLSVLDERVEIEVNRTSTDDDDYVTWAPTFCRARSIGAPNAASAVVLANDAAGAGGELLFDPLVTPWPADTTATQESLTLTLPADGSWVEFAIAGKFGHPSSADKDAVIVCREGSVRGPVIGRKRLMVRVRKDANELSRGERGRFLAAMRALRNRTSEGYVMFQEIHRLASSISNDQGHTQPAFLPWHRALLLHVERELQEIDPSVTLPYWDWDAAAPNVFTEDFIGAGANPGATRGAGGALQEPVFASTNPLNGWNTLLPFASGELRRRTFNQTVAPDAGFFLPLDDPAAGDPDLMAYDDFGPRSSSDSFSWRQERDCHDYGHVWNCGAGHLRRPERSAADPQFYLLHTQVDRQWAYWQWKKNRAGVLSGGGVTFPAPEHYDNAGAWDDSGVTAWFRGAFLEDEMWPWNGASGPGGAGSRDDQPSNVVTPGGTNVADPPPAITATSFPAAPIEGLWPAADVSVKVRHMIDYQGRFDISGRLGFCYDDVPFH